MSDGLIQGEKPDGPRRLRILWLIKDLDPGGAEKLLLSLAKVRDSNAFDYELAYLIPSCKTLLPDFEAEGISVHCLSNGRDLDLRWAWRLRRMLKCRRFDIVHPQMRYPAIIARLVVRSLPRRHRPRLVVTEHLEWDQDRVVTRLLNRLTFRFDDADLGVAERVRKSLPARLQSRMETVVHGLDLAAVEAAAAERHQARQELGVADNEFLVGTVANLRAQKGYEFLLPAAKQMVEEGLPVRFAAVGGGLRAVAVANLHHQLDLGDRFLLLGTRLDAVRIASGFDIFVLASLYEGLPVALMEALALGLPVVVTSVGGMPEIVENGVEGLIVPPGDSDAIAEALRSLIRDPDRLSTMAAAARRRGRKLDITIAARRIEDVYRKVNSRQWSRKSEPSRANQGVSSSPSALLTSGDVNCEANGSGGIS